MRNIENHDPDPEVRKFGKTGNPDLYPNISSEIKNKVFI
jgi:hypothetical protein